MPCIILPKETKMKHLVFQSQWDEPVIQDWMLCVLEVRTSAECGWKALAEWEYPLDVESWSHLAKVGGSFTTAPDRHKQHREFRNPEDLHKYTGTKQEIPKDGFRAAPSYLDYPAKDEPSDKNVEPVAPPDKE
jgi:hypothetical protein